MDSPPDRPRHLRSARPEDAVALGRLLRDEHRREIASGGLSPEDAIRLSLRGSREAYAYQPPSEDAPVFMMGAEDASALTGGAMVWMLGREAVDRHGAGVLRAARWGLRRAYQVTGAAYLEQWIPDWYRVGIRFARRLGFVAASRDRAGWRRVVLTRHDHRERFSNERNIMIDTTEHTVRYPATSGQSVFAIPFRFTDTGQIQAECHGADGTVTGLAAGTDYAVNTVTDGHGELVLLRDDVLRDGDLVISRRVPLTQEIKLPEYAPVPPRMVEDALDKLTMIAQELDGRLRACAEKAALAEAEARAIPALLSAPERDEATALQRVDMVRIGRSGVYHAADCHHVRPTDKCLPLATLLRRRPKARPCRHCRPGTEPVTAEEHNV